jgi:hypothetical protein
VSNQESGERPSPTEDRHPERVNDVGESHTEPNGQPVSAVRRRRRCRWLREAPRPWVSWVLAGVTVLSAVFAICANADTTRRLSALDSALQELKSITANTYDVLVQNMLEPSRRDTLRTPARSVSDSLLRLAGELRANGLRDQAITTLRAAVDADPHNGPAHAALGLSLGELANQREDSGDWRTSESLWLCARAQYVAALDSSDGVSSLSRDKIRGWLAWAKWHLREAGAPRPF